MKKRVLCVYDGRRRLCKDDMMLDSEFEVRVPLASASSSAPPEFGGDRQDDDEDEGGEAGVSGARSPAFAQSAAAGASYVTDLDVQTVRRAGIAIFSATEEERGPWIPDKHPRDGFERRHSGLALSPLPLSSFLQYILLLLLFLVSDDHPRFLFIPITTSTNTNPPAILTAFTPSLVAFSLLRSVRWCLSEDSIDTRLRAFIILIERLASQPGDIVYPIQK